ncbi:peptidoglycan DD-metalloendopeptidase family protein [Solibacillus silvestris]
MQYIPEHLKSVLNNRLKAGFVSRPQCVVEVDRMTYIPGHVEEISFYDYDFIKTIEEPLKENEQVITTDVAATFPLGGLKWADSGKKFTKTSNFGMRNGRPHQGTDLSTHGKASDIVAMWDGTVVTTGFHATAGYRVSLIHDGGYKTNYYHMQKGTIAVKNGQKVKAGQKLGLEGTTGNSTGRHLHVEVLTGATASGSGGKHVDPLPYLKGEKTIKGTGIKVQDTFTKEIRDVKTVEQVVPGQVVFEDAFKSRTWDTNPTYDNHTPSSGVSFSNVDLKNGYFRPTWKFSSTSVTTVRVALNVTMPDEGYFTMNYSGNFSSGDGDHIRIFINDKLLYNGSEFKGTGKAAQIPNIKLPKGNVSIGVIFLYYGKLGASLKEFSLHNLKIQAVDTTESVVQEDISYEEYDVPSTPSEIYKYKESEVRIQLQVGRFVYQDTLTLPNVIQCEVQRNLDQEAADAKITISNPDGYYGPDYNPYYFPDLAARNAQSPYSYTLPGGFHIGVLAENTPIRIYMGYGSKVKPMRVFTGLIDAVSINSAEATLDINARDMYKKIINTVLLNRKVYGKEPEILTKEVKSTKAASVSSLSRIDQIYYWAFKKCEEFKLPKDAAYFLLAIARHETQFGTAGQGRPPRDMILGYGSFDSNPNYSYGGIESQMKWGAKRISEALKSKGFVPKSFEDVKYFWKGGDKGSYQWATDTQWPNKVWAVYKQITGEKSKYNPPTIGGGTEATHTETVGQTGGEQWLKTAIIQDLIGEAGMYGWRSSVDDMRYPDSVIEESYVIDVNQKKGTVVKALPADKATEDTVFETVPIESIKTIGGYLNPFVEPAGKTFVEFQWRIAEAIQDLTKDTNYRSYCDRYGTYRLELLNYEGPVVAHFKDDDNLISLSKTIDHTRSRSHIVVFHDGYKEDDKKTDDRVFASFIDKELQLELKGELRTMSVAVPWAKTQAMKAEVAKKMFFQMKQLARTLQASIPGNPALDILDRVKVQDRNSGTSATYFIKGIRDSFDVNAGYIQIIDLTWAAIDQIVQTRDFIVNMEPPNYEPPKATASISTFAAFSRMRAVECEVWPGIIYKYGMVNNDMVRKVQRYLLDAGYSLSYGADGNFESETLAAVKAFQASEEIEVDGLVGPNTWNKMFCPTAAPVELDEGTKLDMKIKGTRSWRDGGQWRIDNDYLYQGEWEGNGKHKGFIFLDGQDIKEQLNGQEIKSVKLYLESYPKQGVQSEQFPTFWLHNMADASTTPSMMAGTAWKSNVGWASGEDKWVTLPNSFGEALRDGKAKGIGIYTDSSSPYMYFYGSNSMKLQIEIK